MTGVFNAMAYLKMLEVPIEAPQHPAVYCRNSYWMYTDTGGFLRVLPELAEQVEKGQLIAIQTNVFGDVVREYHSPDDGIVIGKSDHPVNRSGGRILHLGLFND